MTEYSCTIDGTGKGGLSEADASEVAAEIPHLSAFLLHGDSMQTLSAAVIGASGYTGVELTRILHAHPSVEVRLLTSDKWQGSTVSQRIGVGGAPGKLVYQAQDQSISLSRGMDVVFLATPAEVSLALVPKLMDTGVKRIIDLSGAFRLERAADYSAYYGFTHTQLELLPQAVYGLPELFRPSLSGATLITNPGCYATASALALAPLVRAKLVEPSSLIVNAASGTTGAGRKATEDMSFTEVDEDFRAYKVHRHQHTPEISQTLTRYAQSPVSVTFTPHLLPIKRGILATAYAQLLPGVDGAQAREALREAYREAAFVDIFDSADAISLKAVVGTNRCHLAIATPPRPNAPLIVLSALDNLVKGAAGQAVQNLNLMMDWPETLGLDSLRGFHP